MNSFRENCAFFNELSAKDCIEEEEPGILFKKFAKTIKYLKQKGFTGIRYENGIGDLNMGNRNIFNFSDGRNPLHNDYLFILSTQKKPYIEENSAQEIPFITNEYEALIEDEWKFGYGLIAAHIHNSVTISLETHPNWANLSFKIRINGNENESFQVLNFSSPHEEDPDLFSQYLDEWTPLELIETEIKPELKHVKFRDDHGKDKLMEFWKRLKNCKYVISAINSLPFDSKSNKTIEKCFPDGILHIRLVDSSKGYGMVVKTSGRNLRETTAIAEHILQQYF